MTLYCCQYSFYGAHRGVRPTLLPTASHLPSAVLPMEEKKLGNGRINGPIVAREDVLAGEDSSSGTALNVC